MKDDSYVPMVLVYVCKCANELLKFTVGSIAEICHFEKKKQTEINSYCLCQMVM